MNFSLTEDQQMVRDMVRKFARERVAPNAHEWSEDREIPDAVIGELAELGLTDAVHEHLDPLSFVLALEELGRADAALAMIVAISATPQAPVVRDAAAQRQLGLWGTPMRPTGTATSAAWQLANAAVAVGVARAALEVAHSYAQEREQFGKPIAAYQAIQFKLADMATAVDAARLMVHHAATGEVAADAALRVAADAAIFVTDEAVQIHGGYGYVREFPVERYYRDARWFALWVGP